MIIQVIPKAIIGHNFIKFQARAETNVNSLYLVRTPLLFVGNTKNISFHVLKISAISLVLRTRKFTDIFITFDGIHLVFNSNTFNIFLVCLVEEE